MIRKVKVSCCIVLAILLTVQVLFSVGAYGTVNNRGEENGTECRKNCINGVLEDDRIAIPDSESSLLPPSNRYNPSRVDLSTNRFFPPVGDQKNINNCVSWASVYYQFGYQVASKYSLNVSSTYNLFSPKWIHNIIKDGEGNFGASFEDAYMVLASNGTVRYSEFTPTSEYLSETELPYEYLPWYLNEEDISNALRYRVSAYHLLKFADIDTESKPISTNNSSSLDNMKRFLSFGSPITFSTDATTWIYGVLNSQYNSSLNGDYVCTTIRDTNNFRDGHALTIVGYDDNITYDLNCDGIIQEFEYGAFKIVNSWGENAYNHNDGFIWVMYDALNKESNASNLNYNDRLPVIENYEYNIINVKEYPCDVIAKVTLNHNDRTQIQLKLGVSDTSSSLPTEMMTTMLSPRFNSEHVNFSGSSYLREEATFVFDFGDLYALDTPRSNCYIQIRKVTGSPIIVKRVELIDGTGKTIVLDTEEKSISNAGSYDFKLGIVGDIDDDTNITTNDMTLIQEYLVSLRSLTSDELSVADVNGDGRVTMSDVSTIQRFISEIIDAFPNGSVMLLNDD